MFAATSGCANVFWRTEAVPMQVDSSGTYRIVRSPIKVHLVDGSTVMFRDGALMGRTRITGEGMHYALLSEAGTRVESVPTDSIVAFETFEGKVLAAPTLVVSAAATAVGAVGFAGLMVLLFGSCPTVYADTGTGPVLEAEGFSYAIAPLFEHRDVDRLRARADSGGVVRLELRNEALETHFINHIELAAVRHDPRARVLPDQSGKIVALRDVRPLRSARDRAKRDVSSQLRSADGELFSTLPATVDAAREGDLNDWLDLDVGDLPAGDSLAVVLRLRNSLLNTVLLYEGMLGGPDAIDWLGTHLQHISTAVDLTRWYATTMGLHAVDGAGTTIARLGDVGPLAFRDVALVLPRAAVRDGRLRLRFVADNWRIDYAAVSVAITRPTAMALPVARVIVPTPERGNAPMLDTAAVGALADADDRYLETRPGQRVTLEFAAAPSATVSDSTTTFMIAWQGWYREWVRASWVANPTRLDPFVPGDAAVVTALRRWRLQQAAFERAFYESRVPVR